MNSMKIGDVLVVFEGVRRVVWRHRLLPVGVPGTPTSSDWVLASVWPDASEQRRVEAHLGAGDPLLVVLDSEPVVISVPAENVTELPAGLPPPPAGADIIDVEIPALDWLPEHLCRRGLAFARHAQARIAAVPDFLRPAVVIDPGDDGPGNGAGAGTEHVRYVYRTGVRTVPPAMLRRIVEHLFDAAGGMAPVVHP